MQTILVIALLVAAVGYLAARAFGLWSGKKQKGCEKCGMPEKKG